MNWVARIKTEKNKSIELYGGFEKRPIHIYPITEDKKFVLTKNDLEIYFSEKFDFFFDLFYCDFFRLLLQL